MGHERVCEMQGLRLRLCICSLVRGAYNARLSFLLARGDDGFIKIAEEGNVCGVASDWVYAVAAATPTAVAA